MATTNADGDQIMSRYRVAACRGCGRSYTGRAPVDATGNDGVIIQCAECGTTNRTFKQVRPS